MLIGHTSSIVSRARRPSKTRLPALDARAMRRCAEQWSNRQVQQDRTRVDPRREHWHDQAHAAGFGLDSISEQHANGMTAEPVGVT
jgi:hypothetical protein